MLLKWVVLGPAAGSGEDTEQLLSSGDNFSYHFVPFTLSASFAAIPCG
jgi:hypothetical protein